MKTELSGSLLELPAGPGDAHAGQDLPIHTHSGLKIAGNQNENDFQSVIAKLGSPTAPSAVPGLPSSPLPNSGKVLPKTDPKLQDPPLQVSADAAVVPVILSETLGGSIAEGTSEVTSPNTTQRPSRRTPKWAEKTEEITVDPAAAINAAALLMAMSPLPLSVQPIQPEGTGSSPEREVPTPELTMAPATMDCSMAAGLPEKSSIQGETASKETINPNASEKKQSTTPGKVLSNEALPEKAGGMTLPAHLFSKASDAVTKSKEPASVQSNIASLSPEIMPQPAQSCDTSLQSLSPLNPPSSHPEDMARSRVPVSPVQEVSVIEGVDKPKSLRENGLNSSRGLGKSPVATDGTGIALKDGGMRNSSEQNNFAGRGMQNLQPEAKDSSAHPDYKGLASSAKPLTTVRLSSSPAFNPSNDLLVSNAYVSALNQAPVTAASQLPSNSIPVEHFSRVIQQEVVTIRQNGAKELGVSLKVDHQTQIFLKVTNHNGRISASIECEKGSLADLNRAMPDLQASLARQNISLVPANSSQPINNPTLATFSKDTGNSAANPDSQGQARSFFQGQEKRQSQGGLENIFGTNDVSSVSSKTKTNQPTTISRTDGWEKWA